MIRGEAEQGFYHDYKTSTDANHCGHHSARSYFPGFGADTGEVSCVTPSHCSQQPCKEPGIRTSHGLPEPRPISKRQQARSHAQGDPGGDPALMKAASARPISILAASWMMAFRLCLLRWGQPRCSLFGNRRCLRLPKHFFHSTVGFLGICHLGYRLRPALRGLLTLSEMS